MNDPECDRAEAIHQIAAILATAYLRLRFPAPPQRLLTDRERPCDCWLTP